MKLQGRIVIMGAKGGREGRWWRIEQYPLLYPPYLSITHLKGAPKFSFASCCFEASKQVQEYYTDTWILHRIFSSFVLLHISILKLSFKYKLTRSLGSRQGNFVFCPLRLSLQCLQCWTFFSNFFAMFAMLKKCFLYSLPQQTDRDSATGGSISQMANKQTTSLKTI